MGCEALPALSNLACCLRTLSLMVSQSAVIRTPGTLEKLSISEPPRPPVPITPMRTSSRGLNFRSATLLLTAWFAFCDRASPAPKPASDASFNKSRREESFMVLSLVPKFSHDLNQAKSAGNKDAAKYQSVGGAAIQKIADGKERGPDGGAAHDPAGEGQRNIVSLDDGGGGQGLDVTPAGTEGAHLLIEADQHGLVGPRPHKSHHDPGDGGDRHADDQLLGEADGDAVL